MSSMMKETEAAAPALGVHLQLAAVKGPKEFDQAFSTIAAERTDALIVPPSPMLFNERRRPESCGQPTGHSRLGIRPRRPSLTPCRTPYWRVLGRTLAHRVMAATGLRSGRLSGNEP